MNNTTKVNRIFVYGTLMRGQPANHYLSEGKYLGRYVLQDYAMYDLGEYPGILECPGESVVGEVYEVPESLWAPMDRYEGVSVALYYRRTVTVRCYSEELDVQVYVYGHGDRCLGPMMRTPWGGETDEDFVWYAAYGSNLSLDRLACYIDGGICKWNNSSYAGIADKTPPREIQQASFPGRLYFSKKSHKWGNSSVAFFDPAPSKLSDVVHMRLYKITHAQLLRIQEQEGRGWYHNIHFLGMHEDGVPIYTLTSDIVWAPSAPPAANYRNCLLNGLIEMGIERNEAANYLDQWMPKSLQERYKEMLKKEETY